jgi:hypothetical protein
MRAGFAGPACSQARSLPMLKSGAGRADSETRRARDERAWVMDHCPRCGSTRVYPSRHRGFAERLRQVFTEKRPYRCHACGWRAWAQIEIRLSRHHAELDPETLRRPSRERAIAPEELDRLEPGEPQAPRRPTRPGPLTDDDFDGLDPR